MQILLFADKNNKALLQELLNWSKYNNLSFLMCLSTDSKKIQDYLDNFYEENNTLLVSFHRSASLYLAKKSLKFKELELNEFRKNQTI